MTASDVINNRCQEFVSKLENGQLSWDAEEMASFFLQVKQNASEMTYPEFSLGPTDKSRCGQLSRTVAALRGVDVRCVGGKYVFSGAGAGIKVVSLPEIKPEPKKEQPPVNDKLSCPVIFPSAPPVAKSNPHYVTPAWHKRMALALDAGKHVAIAGPPGGGKSTAPEQYFANKHQPFVTVNGDAGFRRRDMEGSVEIQAGTTFFRVADFAAAAVNGWGCILNEVNAADPDALLFINGILEVPHVVNIQGKSYQVHPDFRLVVTFNPGLVGTKPLPQAFIDRFFPIKLGFPPRPFLRKLLEVKGMSSGASYAERLLKYAEDAWCLHEKGNLRYQISPRRLFDVVFLMDSGMVTNFEDAVKQAIVDAVHSPADAAMLMKLITTPLGAVGPVSQYA